MKQRKHTLNKEELIAQQMIQMIDGYLKKIESDDEEIKELMEGLPKRKSAYTKEQLKELEVLNKSLNEMNEALKEMEQDNG